MMQVKKGRVVMSVDSTNLLNLRHVLPNGSDDLWRMPYTEEDEYMTFDQVRVYPPLELSSNNNHKNNNNKNNNLQSSGNVSGAKLQEKVAIVTYGNGVLAALQARQILLDEMNISNITIIDCPLLSQVPNELRTVIPDFDSVVFADVCKEGQHPLAAHLTRLQNERLLPSKWRVVAAQYTYNPLGSTITFLSKEDIVWEVLHLVKGVDYVKQWEQEMSLQRLK
jgi:hypothetical protein